MWEENQHPRDNDGKFADKEGGGSNGGSTTSGVTERVKRSSSSL